VNVRSRLVASFLILLITVPFTAPFSTCDLTVLIAARDGHALAWSSPDGSVASMEAVSTQATSGSVLEEKQFKDGALTAVSVIAPVSTLSHTASPLDRQGAAVRPTLVALRL
jgi:hypothetical protein